jgi:peptidoglycan/LPS O-acetylase OafA/YrhL
VGEPARTDRFAFVDALRGIAALAVAVFHLSGGASKQFFSRLPGWVTAGIEWGGHLGVVVFFVISGFVMAYSLKEARPTVGFLSRFLVRRLVRLAPPYWASVLLILVVPQLVSAATGNPPRPFTWAQVLPHFLYLHRAFGQPHLEGLFWTLCVEVQFYLAHAVVLGLALRAVGERGKGWVFLALGGLALAAPAGLLGPDFRPGGLLYHDWFVATWYMFLVGSVVWLAAERRLPWAAPAAVAAAAVGLGVWQADPRCAAAGVTAGGILVAAARGRLGDWLTGRTLQYLGRISYSLYLAHTPVGYPIIYAGERVFRDSPAGGLVTYLAALTASLAAAHLMYRWVERPSIGWSRRLKGDPAAAARRWPAVLIGGIVAVAGGELAARFVIGLGDPPLYVADPEVEYRLAPTQDCRRFGNRILVNRWSMRSDDFPPHKTDPRELRVLVVGDNVVNGGNPTDHAALATTQLGPIITAATGRPAVVGNVSAGSWGPPNQLAYLAKFGTFDAEVVVFVWNHEDWADVPSFAPLDPVQQPTRKPVSAAWEGVERYLWPRFTGGTSWPPGPTGTTGAAITDAVKLVQGRGAKAAAVLHWSRPELAAGKPNPGLEEVRQAAAGVGALVTDDADALRRADGDPFRDDIHLSDAGQRALLGVLRAVALQQLPK